MSLTTRPLTPARAHDLTDAEFAELDELLAQTPEPLEPLDAVMLDGYLCGVIVQPVLLESATWLAHVFDFDATPLPDGTDPAWLERTTALVMRRHAALNRAIVEDGWFDPLILEPDGEEDNATAGDAAPATAVDEEAPTSAGVAPVNPWTPKAADADGDAAPGAAAAPADADPTDALGPISQALLPWVAGFQHATHCFPDLLELPDEAVTVALARLFRHLPADTDDDRELVALLDKEQPLTTLDDAMEDLVTAVADLHDLTEDARYHVETIRRDAPKVGRNEPCPCGSGKKFKQCHGAG